MLLKTTAIKLFISQQLSICRLFTLFWLLFIVFMQSATPVQAELLYQVQWKEKKLWLLGTVHTAPIGQLELSEQAKQAIRQSKIVWLEIDPQNAGSQGQAMIQRGMRDEPYLKDELTEDTWRQLETQAARAGVAPSLIQRMEPWLVESLLVLAWLQQNGYSGQYGLDWQVMHYAKSHQKPVNALETIMQQIDALSQAYQDQSAQEHIGKLIQQQKTIVADAHQLIQSWKAKDTKYFQQLITQEFTPRTQHILLIERNLQWLQVLVDQVQEQEVHFIAVGAAHLFGEQGLLDLLERSGADIRLGAEAEVELQD